MKQEKEYYSIKSVNVADSNQSKFKFKFRTTFV